MSAGAPEPDEDEETKPKGFPIEKELRRKPSRGRRSVGKKKAKKAKKAKKR